MYYLYTAETREEVEEAVEVCNSYGCPFDFSCDQDCDGKFMLIASLPLEEVEF